MVEDKGAFMAEKPLRQTLLGCCTIAAKLFPLLMRQKWLASWRLLTIFWQVLVILGLFLAIFGLVRQTDHSRYRPLRQRLNDPIRHCGKHLVSFA